MTSVVFYFQVHQPYRLRRIEGNAEASPDHSEQAATDLPRNGSAWFDDKLNRRILERVAEKCYLPMNRLLLRLIEENDGRFRCAFALTGTVLQQLEDWSPEALESFVDLARTGCVEFVCETAYHSLASQGSPGEFEEQVIAQRDRLETLFGARPTSFRNTELIFDGEIAQRVEALGFDVLLGEGADRLLGDVSPRQVFRPAGCRRLKLLLRDYLFSDDIAFRFSNREWEQYPLMADTFADWLHRSAKNDAFVGLFMDYETFGEHQGPDTGIFDFMEHVPRYVLADERFSFETPAEVARANEPRIELEVPDPISWADAERDLSAWLSNPMQRTAHAELYALGPAAHRAAQRGHPELLHAWRKLTTSDHVYYMCTKFYSDGDVHEYFSPYESPHDSYIVFMNVLDDLKGRLRELLGPTALEDSR